MKCRACATKDGGAFWDPNVEKCVTVCPDVRPKVESGVCNACPEKTIWKNGECVECAKANPARPIWDDKTSTCRACGADDEGLFWDGAQCIEKCPQTANIQRVCKTCVDIDSKKPYWDGEKSKCSECPSGEVWDKGEQRCVPCGDNEIWVDGSC